MPIARLADRSIISVTGPDAEALLQGVVTTDVETLGEGEARASALLTPQGKILCDFLVSRMPGGFRLDVARDAAQDLVRRLTLYRLRAKAEIALDAEAAVAVSWGPEAESGGSPAMRDGRFPPDFTVLRHYGEALPAPEGDADEWTRLRIDHGIAEAGADYPFGDAFPHDVNLDQTGGISFAKGCYVGQEVVSRMQHRGTARKRVLVAHGEGELPSSGASIASAGREIGTLGSKVGRRGLALVRIDRAKAAIDAGADVTAGSIPVGLELPQGVRFAWSAAGSTDDN